MLDGFLPDLHSLADRAQQMQLLQFGSYGGQGRASSKMVRCRCDRLVHGDTPFSNESSFVPSLAMEYRSAFYKLFNGSLDRRQFGRNLGSLNILSENERLYYSVHTLWSAQRSS